MSSKVAKHCSILNYLRHNEKELHELIQDLCLGKMFTPRKGTNGITFLIPDAALKKELMKMASDEDPEPAIKTLQSLVLLDCYEKLTDFDDSVANYLRKQLPVDTSMTDGTKVVLTNGGVITVNKDFSARADRKNINVFNLSKKLPDLDTNPISGGKKATKGGADYARADRLALFQQVLSAFATCQTDPAMELLVCLHCWAEEKKYTELAEKIQHELSYDTLASLAIILEPYSSTREILSDAQFAQFTAETGAVDSLKNYTNVFCYCKDVSSKYDQLMKCDAKNPDLCNKQVELVDNIAKPNAVSALQQFISENMPGANVAKEIAKAELRVVSALKHDFFMGAYTVEELTELYSTYKLDKPYMCNQETVKNSDLAFYYSTVYLICRSDALCHDCGRCCKYSDGMASIADDNAMIGLSNYVGGLLKSRREASQKCISDIREKASR